ncbi:MAG: head-tail connector protein [Mesorhizobium sp.]|nr:head-tail connector protein [Mesorhizobium sp.]
MTLYRTVEPAAEPVTLADAKAQLRVAHDSEDELLSGLIRAARAEVEAQTGMALIDQAWRLALDRWPFAGIVRLRRHPVREILSVTVYGAEGEAQLVDPASYQADLASRPARLHFTGNVAPERRLNGIEIDFSAGFGEAGTDVPDLLKRAILMLVAHWYEFRVVYGADSQPVSIPPGFDRLIAGYRAGRL